MRTAFALLVAIASLIAMTAPAAADPVLTPIIIWASSALAEAGVGAVTASIIATVAVEAAVAIGCNYPCCSIAMKETDE